MKVHDRPSPSALPDQRAESEPAATPVAQVMPLSYTQLRLLAEQAAGLTRPQDFVFPGGTSLQVAAAPAEPGDVLVPASGAGKFPDNAVSLQPAPTAGVLDLPETGITADAVFWSDAAVQKFLLPYVTSCAGSDASRVLTRVQAAWNYYPAARVTVYALVHVVRCEGVTALSLEGSIHVAYAERLDGEEQPTLALAPLDAFLERHPPAPSAWEALRRGAQSLHGAAGAAADASHRLVDYHRGADGDRSVTPGYETLRALAEFASSIRDEPRYFLLKANEEGFRRHPTQTLPPVEAGDIVIPAHTPSVPAQRPRLHGVWFHPQGGLQAENLWRIGDAVFWSTGAIERFLYPYYASKGGLQEGLKELVELAYLWIGQVPPGLGRDGTAAPRSGSVDAAMPEETGSTAPRVAGYVHMPTSEYIPESRAAATGSGTTTPAAGEVVARLSPRRELGVVYVDADDRTRVSTAAEFMARHWPRQG